MNRLLDSLIAQWRLCGADKCRRVKCRRCRRAGQKRDQ